MGEEKTQCRKCGLRILALGAKKRDGLCGPCWKDVEVGRRMKELESKEPSFLTPGPCLEDVQNCSSLFAFQCPKQWSELHETGAESTRFCDVCQKSVHYCRTPDEFVRLGELGECVAIPAEVAFQNRGDELGGSSEEANDAGLRSMSETMTLGFPSLEVFEDWERQKQLRYHWWKSIVSMNPDMPDSATSFEDAKRRIRCFEDELRWLADQRQQRAEMQRRAAASSSRMRTRVEEATRRRKEIEAISDRENWGKVGECPHCGFIYRWDGVRCAHCRFGVKEQ